MAEDKLERGGVEQWAVNLVSGVTDLVGGVLKPVGQLGSAVGALVSGKDVEQAAERSAQRTDSAVSGARGILNPTAEIIAGSIGQAPVSLVSLVPQSLGISNKTLRDNTFGFLGTKDDYNVLDFAVDFATTVIPIGKLAKAGVALPKFLSPLAKVGQVTSRGTSAVSRGLTKGVDVLTRPIAGLATGITGQGFKTGIQRGLFSGEGIVGKLTSSVLEKASSNRIGAKFWGLTDDVVEAGLSKTASQAEKTALSNALKNSISEGIKGTAESLPFVFGLAGISLASPEAGEVLSRMLSAPIKSELLTNLYEIGTRKVNSNIGKFLSDTVKLNLTGKQGVENIVENVLDMGLSPIRLEENGISYDLSTLAQQFTPASLLENFFLYGNLPQSQTSAKASVREITESSIREADAKTVSTVSGNAEALYEKLQQEPGYLARFIDPKTQQVDQARVDYALKNGLDKVTEDGTIDESAIVNQVIDQEGFKQYNTLVTEMGFEDGSKKWLTDNGMKVTDNNMDALVSVEQFIAPIREAMPERFRIVTPANFKVGDVPVSKEIIEPVLKNIVKADYEVVESISNDPRAVASISNGVIQFKADSITVNGAIEEATHLITQSIRQKERDVLYDWVKGKYPTLSDMIREFPEYKVVYGQDYNAYADEVIAREVIKYSQSSKTSRLLQKKGIVADTKRALTAVVNRLKSFFANNDPMREFAQKILTGFYKNTDIPNRGVEGDIAATNQADKYLSKQRVDRKLEGKISDTDKVKLSELKNQYDSTKTAPQIATSFKDTNPILRQLKDKKIFVMPEDPLRSKIEGAFGNSYDTKLSNLTRKRDNSYTIDSFFLISSEGGATTAMSIDDFLMEVAEDRKRMKTIIREQTGLRNRIKDEVKNILEKYMVDVPLEVPPVPTISEEQKLQSVQATADLVNATTGGEVFTVGNFDTNLQSFTPSETEVEADVSTDNEQLPQLVEGSVIDDINDDIHSETESKLFPEVREEPVLSDYTEMVVKKVESKSSLSMDEIRATGLAGDISYVNARMIQEGINIAFLNKDEYLELPDGTEIEKSGYYQSWLLTNYNRISKGMEAISLPQFIKNNGHEGVLIHVLGDIRTATQVVDSAKAEGNKLAINKTASSKMSVTDGLASLFHQMSSFIIGAQGANQTATELLKESSALMENYARVVAPIAELEAEIARASSDTSNPLGKGIVGYKQIQKEDPDINIPVRVEYLMNGNIPQILGNIYAELKLAYSALKKARISGQDKGKIRKVKNEVKRLRFLLLKVPKQLVGDKTIRNIGALDITRQMASSTKKYEYLAKNISDNVDGWRESLKQLTKVRLDTLSKVDDMYNNISEFIKRVYEDTIRGQEAEHEKYYKIATMVKESRGEITRIFNNFLGMPLNKEFSGDWYMAASDSDYSKSDRNSLEMDEASVYNYLSEPSRLKVSRNYRMLPQGHDEFSIPSGPIIGALNIYNKIPDIQVRNAFQGMSDAMVLSSKNIKGIEKTYVWTVIERLAIKARAIDTRLKGSFQKNFFTSFMGKIITPLKKLTLYQYVASFASSVVFSVPTAIAHLASYDYGVFKAMRTVSRATIKGVFSTSKSFESDESIRTVLAMQNMRIEPKLKDMGKVAKELKDSGLLGESNIVSGMVNMGINGLKGIENMVNSVVNKVQSVGDRMSIYVAQDVINEVEKRRGRQLSDKEKYVIVSSFIASINLGSSRLNRFDSTMGDLSAIVAFGRSILSNFKALSKVSGLGFVEGLTSFLQARNGRLMDVVVKQSEISIQKYPAMRNAFKSGTKAVKFMVAFFTVAWMMNFLRNMMFRKEQPIQDSFGKALSDTLLGPVGLFMDFVLGDNMAKRFAEDMSGAITDILFSGDEGKVTEGQTKLATTGLGFFLPGFLIRTLQELGSQAGIVPPDSKSPETDDSIDKAIYAITGIKQKKSKTSNVSEIDQLVFHTPQDIFTGNFDLGAVTANLASSPFSGVAGGGSSSGRSTSTSYVSPVTLSRTKRSKRIQRYKAKSAIERKVKTPKKPKVKRLVNLGTKVSKNTKPKKVEKNFINSIDFII